jgi:hypothetical protein
VPAATRIMPVLTPIAATGLVITMIGAQRSPTSPSSALRRRSHPHRSRHVPRLVAWVPVVRTRRRPEPRGGSLASDPRTSRAARLAAPSITRVAKAEVPATTAPAEPEMTRHRNNAVPGHLARPPDENPVGAVVVLPDRPWPRPARDRWAAGHRKVRHRRTAGGPVPLAATGPPFPGGAHLRRRRFSLGCRTGR